MSFSPYFSGYSYMGVPRFLHFICNGETIPLPLWRCNSAAVTKQTFVLFESV